ncbi:MAG: hypothetical protein LBM68_03180 [Bacteroidales bacterium]|jgi:hypothetical protein|nr:hypothetical protein [Bacteroidales bacterium]
MTIVSTKEFNSNQEKYFDMAINEQVFVQRGNYVFIVSRVNAPDDDFGKEITVPLDKSSIHRVANLKGRLKQYANPALLQKEASAWEHHIVEKYATT